MKEDENTPEQLYNWVYLPLRLRIKGVRTQEQVTEQGTLGCGFAFGLGLSLFLLALDLFVVAMLWSV